MCRASVEGLGPLHQDFGLRLKVSDFGLGFTASCCGLR